MAGDNNWEALLPPHWKASIKAWLLEDVPSFDIGGFVVGEKETVAHLYGKSPGVFCGVPFFNAVFEELGCTVEWKLSEGGVITPGADGKQLVAIVRGKVRHILLGERTALNIVTRASGVATQAREMSDIAKAAGWHGSVAGTRKTTPGFRLVEKYALLVGGVSTHRYDLSSMVMLKDNHVWSAGDITHAVVKARSAAGFSTKIEVECRSVQEAFEAVSAGAEVVMLDNFDAEGLRQAAATVKDKCPHVTIEASGGITKDTIASFMCPHVDVISVGALTQGYKCLDLSLKVQK